MKEAKGYVLIEALNDDQKWNQLLKLAINDADFAEFNLLYRSNNKASKLESIEPDLVQEGRRKDKIYSSGSFRRYRLTEQVKDFIIAKPYKSWNNYPLEDLSLLKDGIEILATITHENYIYLLLDVEQRRYLHGQGFSFQDLL